jgi:short-subunit dehydrogenase
MKKPVALIFGHRGGIGLATCKALIAQGYRLIPVDRTIIDFDKTDADAQVSSLLTNSRPNVIVNCAGVFENGHNITHSRTMNVNFGSNWSIVRHYMNPMHQINPCRVIMVGSSCYDQGRQLYPLYSASKAAVYNLWQSARDAFKDTNICIDLINPVRTLTKMATANKAIDHSLPYLRPEQVADAIINLVTNKMTSSCINMTFEDEK